VDDDGCLDIGVVDDFVRKDISVFSFLVYLGFSISGVDVLHNYNCCVSRSFDVI
jgi:hypothetical protein